MILNSERHCQAYEDNSIEPVVFNEYRADDWDSEEDEKDDWKRLVRYIAGIVVFFYVLFVYLI